MIIKQGFKAGMAKAYLEAVEAFEVNVKNVTVPFIVFHGDKDEICNLKGSKHLYKEAASKDKQLVVLENTLHELFFEKQRFQILEQMVNWIKERI